VTQGEPDGLACLVCHAASPSLAGLPYGYECDLRTLSLKDARLSLKGAEGAGSFSRGPPSGVELADRSRERRRAG
jgi:hypothetical protein